MRTVLYKRAAETISVPVLEAAENGSSFGSKNVAGQVVNRSARAVANSPKFNSKPFDLATVPVGKSLPWIAGSGGYAIGHTMSTGGMNAYYSPGTEGWSKYQQRLAQQSTPSSSRQQDQAAQDRATRAMAAGAIGRGVFDHTFGAVGYLGYLPAYRTLYLKDPQLAAYHQNNFNQAFPAFADTRRRAGEYIGDKARTVHKYALTPEGRNLAATGIAGVLGNPGNSIQYGLLPWVATPVRNAGRAVWNGKTNVYNEVIRPLTGGEWDYSRAHYEPYTVSIPNPYHGARQTLATLPPVAPEKMLSLQEATNAFAGQLVYALEKAENKNNPLSTSRLLASKAEDNFWSGFHDYFAHSYSPYSAKWGRFIQAGASVPFALLGGLGRVARKTGEGVYNTYFGSEDVLDNVTDPSMKKTPEQRLVNIVDKALDPIENKITARHHLLPYADPLTDEWATDQIRDQVVDRLSAALPMSDEIKEQLRTAVDKVLHSQTVKNIPELLANPEKEQDKQKFLTDLVHAALPVAYAAWQNDPQREQLKAQSANR